MNVNVAALQVNAPGELGCRGYRILVVALLQPLQIEFARFAIATFLHAGEHLTTTVPEVAGHCHHSSAMAYYV